MMGAENSYAYPYDQYCFDVLRYLKKNIRIGTHIFDFSQIKNCVECIKKKLPFEFIFDGCEYSLVNENKFQIIKSKNDCDNNIIFNFPDTKTCYIEKLLFSN